MLELRLLEERARRQARADLDVFGQYVFGLKTPPHLKLLNAALQGIFEGEIKNLVTIYPPGHGKSTYASIVWPSWYLGHRYNDSLIGITTVETLGELYGDTVRTAIEASPEYRSVFPGVEPDYRRGWAKGGFFVKGPKPRSRHQKDASMVFTGTGGPIIGRRADGVIVDDPIDEATARSETKLLAAQTWIGRTAFSRLKRDAWRVISGTLWTEGDIVDTAMQSGEYVTIHTAAESDQKLVLADLWIPNGVKWRPPRVAV